MSLIYLKIEDKKAAEQLLQKLLKRYGSEIVAYDMEEIDCVDLSDSSLLIEYRKVQQKGGSLQVTIPSSIVQYLQLEPKTTLYFILRKRIGKLSIAKGKYIVTISEAIK